MLLFHVSEFFLSVTRTASSGLSLDIPVLFNRPAGLFAPRANGIGSERYSDELSKRLILTMDHSRAALTATLVEQGIAGGWRCFEESMTQVSAPIAGLARAGANL